MCLSVIANAKQIKQPFPLKYNTQHPFAWASCKTELEIGQTNTF